MERSQGFAAGRQSVELQSPPAGRRQPRVTCRLLLRPFFLLLAVIIFGNASFAIARQLEQMEHRRWIAADGGPSQVGAIAQTSDGYLWLGTNESLFRFDGFRFVRYEAPDGSPLGIVSTLLAVDNELWVGLRAGGVDVIHRSGIRRYNAGSGLPGGVIYSLARDRNNAIWAAADDGLARFDGSRWQRISTTWNFPGQKARAVFVDLDGVLWAANENRLFYLPIGARNFVDTGLAVDWTSKITQARDGSIWLTERYKGKVHRVVLAGGKIAASTISIDAASNGLLFDRGSGLWISTLGNGVQYVANPSAVTELAKRTPFNAKDGLSSDYIWPMLEDTEGNVWIGTNAGLDRFRLRTLMPANFPASALNFAMAAGDDGSLWAGTSNRPAMRLSDDRIDFLQMPAPVTCAMRDADGNIWMGGPHGIWRSEGKRLVHVTPLPAMALKDSSVRAMVRDATGDLWVSINRLGLFKLHAGHWVAVPPPSSIPSQMMPVSATADSYGRLWFGYRDNLLMTRDAAGERRWGIADGMDIGHITAILPHGKRVWIGGQHGIGFIEGDRFRPLRLPANGLFDNVYAIIAVPVQDGQGDDLWIHAKSGIFQLAAAELARAVADPDYQIRYRSYDLMGGMANDPYQILPLPTAVRSKDGRLWFSTSNGVMWIDPAMPKADDAGPTVMIESVTVDGVRTGATSHAELAPNTQRIVIDYTALSLSAPESLHFRYRMDGYDRTWQDAGRQRQAVYTGLRAGDYRFRVLAYSKDGLPSAKEAVFAFNVPLAFYRQPLFLASAGFLVFGMLWLFCRTNVRRAAERMRERLEERHGERERIARELHDTLLQGVQGLMLRFQAITDVIPSSHPTRRDLEQALDRADQVLSEGRDRVRNLRSGATDVWDLHQALLAVGIASEQEGSAVFNMTERGEPIVLHSIVREEIYRIGHEAIVNTFKHARAQHVAVEINYSAQWFQLKIIDDGCGIDTAYLTPRGRPDHWGLRGMHERAGKIGATLAILSVPSKGSEICVRINGSLAYRYVPRHFLLRWTHLKKKGNQL